MINQFFNWVSSLFELSAYDDGYNCFHMQWRYDECPYIHGTQKAIDWQNGWCDAKSATL